VVFVKRRANFANGVSLEKSKQVQEVIIVTGPAGAGRTTAIKALEDFGIETIDNLPLNLVSRILSGPATGAALAIGIDSRTRGFSSSALLDTLDIIDNNPDYSATLMFLDCSAEILLRRFSETRRKHPASPDGTPIGGIESEISLLSELRNRADILLDTSQLSPHQLKAELAHWFDVPSAKRLSVSVQSFSYKRGTPRSVDMMIDCRFLRNPHWDKALRSLTGLDSDVASYVQEDPLFEPFYEKLEGLLALLLPAYRSEGKAYFTIGLGCTGGQHRSVFVAEKLAAQLANEGWMVNTRHKEMDRWPERKLT